MLGAILAACGGSTRRDVFDEDQDVAGTSSGAPTDPTGSSSSGGISGSSSSSSGDLPACATATATATPAPIYLDIILDGSRSMDGYTNAAYASTQDTMCEPGTYAPWMGNDPGTCFLANSRETDPLQSDRKTGKKWLAARGALKAYFDAHAVGAPNLAVGLFLFSSSAPGDVPVALLDANHASSLWGLIDPGTWPDQGTPISDSLNTRASALRSFSPQDPLLPDGRRVILLITDGVPSTPDSKQNVRSAVQNALNADPSVATAVIGVGNPGDDADAVYDASFLSKLAKLGGVSAPGCDENWSDGSTTTPCHLQVTPGASSADDLQAQMTAAIDAIAGSLASCELTLDKSSPIDPAKVNVVYVDAAGAETQVAQDGANGWTYDDDADPSKVILHGASCEQLKASQGGSVSIVIGCPTGTTVVN